MGSFELFRMVKRRFEGACLILTALIGAVQLLGAGQAAASDFSGMAHPATARSMLMSPFDQRMVRCVRIWTARGDRSRLAPLVDEIVARTSILLGYPVITRESTRFAPLDPQSSQFYLQMEKETAASERANARAKRTNPRTAAEKVRRDAADAAEDAAADAALDARANPPVELPPLPTECARLTEVFNSKGAGPAIALLGPRPTAPIQLPSVGACLAVFDGSHDGFEEIPGQLLGPSSKLDASEKERLVAERDAARANHKVTIPLALGRRKIVDYTDVQQNALAQFFCISTLMRAVERATGLPMRFDDPKTWPHLNLFSEWGAIDSFDKDVSTHPQRLPDTNYRLTVGLPEWALPSPR